MSHLTSHLVRCAGSFPCRSGPRHVPTGTLHGLQFPLVHIHCCTTYSSIATPCRNTLHLVPISCRMIASQWAAIEKSYSMPEAPPALLLHWPCLQVFLSYISYSSLPATLAQQISSFLNLLSQSHTQCCSWLSSGQR